MRAGAIRLDYIGFGLLALGVGALQVALDKGQQDDWLGSRFIITLLIIAVVCLTSLVIWEWFHKNPIIELRLFKNLNFTSANVMMLVLGVIYFSSLVMMPQFLQTLIGYDATKAGLVLSSAGIVLLTMLPVVGQLTGRIQARFLIALGWCFVALSMMYTARSIDLTLSFRTASWLRVMQAAGLPLLFVPITLAAYVGLPQEKSSSAAGLINFMRNIGSSIGTSMVTTLIAQRSQFHQSHLVPRIAPDNPAFQSQLDALGSRLGDAGLGAYEGHRQALARIYQMVQSQAAALAYVDTFWLLGFGAGVMFALSFVLRKNDPRGGATVRNP